MQQKQLNNKARKPVIFLHIPKTAGSTFRAVLENEYEEEVRFSTKVVDGNLNIDEFKNLSQSDKNKIELLYGHMKYGLHQQFEQPINYITFLRDPVKRVISNYYYLLRSPFHPYYEVVKNNNLSLYQYVEQDINKSINNGYIQFISNKSEVTEKVYNEVITNIKNTFSVVGVTEQFDLSLLLMKKKLNWSKAPYYASVNISKNKPQGDFEDQALVELINSKNQFDLKLYNYAKELLQEEARQLTSDEIKSFQKMNNSIYKNKYSRFIFNKLRR